MPYDVVAHIYACIDKRANIHSEAISPEPLLIAWTWVSSCKLHHVCGSFCSEVVERNAI